MSIFHLFIRRRMLRICFRTCLAIKIVVDLNLRLITAIISLLSVSNFEFLLVGWGISELLNFISQHFLSSFCLLNQVEPMLLLLEVINLLLTFLLREINRLLGLKPLDPNDLLVILRFFRFFKNSLNWYHNI